MVTGTLALDKGPGPDPCLLLSDHCCLAPTRYSVENAFFDEKEDTCTALGEIAVHTR